MGRYEEAATALETALERLRQYRVAVPFEPDVLAVLARCRAELGEIENARRLLEEYHGASRRLDLSFGDESVTDVARAMLLCDGPAAADAITKMLPTREKLATFGRLGRLGEILECRALLAHALGDEAEVRRQLGLALEAYEEIGATGHQARVEQLLVESDTGNDSSTNAR